MDDLTRAEYPALLANLQPSQAVQVLTDRVKRINKINLEVADWMQERRRIEEAYVQGLRRLAQFKVPNSVSELGVFQGPWTRIVDSVETIALSHHQLAQRIEIDIENPLRAFPQRPDYSNVNTISVNLSNLAKDLEEAQDKSEKLNKKGGKANSSKIDEASAKLESAQSQWESQAPFVFETLQALDESRVNHLRDLLTQYSTHESDQSQRSLDTAAEILAQMLEISTEKEIQGFAAKTMSGRPKLLGRVSTRHGSIAGTQASADPAAPAVPAVPGTSSPEQTPSQAPETSQPPSQFRDEEEDLERPLPEKKGGKLRRLGTVFGGRKRQSQYGGIGPSPQKKAPLTLGRLGSSHGRSASPRASSSNLQDAYRLSSLAETDSATPSEGVQSKAPAGHQGPNGLPAGLIDTRVSEQPDASSRPNGDPLGDISPPPGPPLSQLKEAPSSPAKDSEGFTIPSTAHDPISEAQREAANGEEADQLFKLNIANRPMAEEDPREKQAALSSVANSLKLGPAVQRSGTVRGRRDVRNTIYVPSPTSTTQSPATEGTLPTLPGSPPGRPAGLGTFASETSATGSDSQSVRSSHSLGSATHVKHPDMTGPGLNSSIVETITATFEDGEVKSATMAGEIAFVINQAQSSKSHETIRINNFPNLERIGPNRIFVQNTSPDQPDHFTLDVSHLARTSTAFSYRVYADQSEGPTSLGQFAPLVVKPSWKLQGDKLGLLLQYSLNPASKFTAPVTLHNVAFVVTYEGAASGAQTKPSGTHLRDKHLVYWRLGDVTLTNQPQKIICRIIGAEGAEPRPGHVEARWEYTVPEGETTGSGISISRLEESKGKARENDPFADEGSELGEKWLDVPTVRKLMGGKYEGREVTSS